MPKFPKLNLPTVELRLRREGGQIRVWDPLRGCWLLLTPEEWVRRHLIGLLTARCNVAPLRIVQEYPVELNGQPQRADIVVVDDEAKPWLLAECKAPEVKISQETLAQAVRYNSVVQAPYILLSNGLTTFCCARSGGDYRPLSRIPRFGEAEKREGDE